MLIFLVVIHVIVCLFLIGVVLLQQGKSADLAGAFGGQGSQTAFGPRGAANLLTKLTTWGAVLFMVISISLTVMLLAHQRRPLRPLRDANPAVHAQRSSLALHPSPRGLRQDHHDPRDPSRRRAAVQLLHPGR